jgi:hypothetical protein
VVVEDLDHAAVFAHPSCPALERYVVLYDELTRLRGGDPSIGPKLPGMLRDAGLGDIHLRMVQPVFMEGPPKRIHLTTLENVRDPMVDTGLATADDLDAMAAEMETFADDPDTIVAFPRIFQAYGHRPTAA